VQANVTCAVKFSMFPNLVGRCEFSALLNNGGVFDVQFENGRRTVSTAIADGGDRFTASPVAADGKIYLSNEDGEI
jgi:outer membrane protein assembly factor BamB